MGSVAGDEPVLVRMHSECLTGDVFRSRRCDCGPQLDKALAHRSRPRDGASSCTCGRRGAGSALLNKMRAYELQDQGKDTVEANAALGFHADLRDYGIGAQILVDLGVKNLRAPHQQPEEDRRPRGVRSAQSPSGCPIEIPATETNRKYLSTKRDKLGHLLSSLPD